MIKHLYIKVLLLLIALSFPRVLLAANATETPSSKWRAVPKWCAQLMERSSSGRQRVEVLPANSQSSQNEQTAQTRSSYTAASGTQRQTLRGRLVDVYRQGQNLIGRIEHFGRNFSLGRLMDPDLAIKDSQKHEAAQTLVEKLLGMNPYDPLAEELRRAVLTSAAARNQLRPLERHIDRLLAQSGGQVSSLHRYLIRILVDVVWKFRADHHPFVQRAMSLIERVNATHTLIHTIGVFEQAILYSNRFGGPIEKAIDIVLGRDPQIQNDLRGSYLVEASFESTENTRTARQEMLLNLYVTLGQRMNQIGINLGLQPTSSSSQDLQDRLREVSPFLSELPSVFNGFWIVEQIGRINAYQETTLLFDSEIREPLDGLLNHTSRIIQARSFTAIEEALLLELLKALAFGGVEHPFVADSIEGFTDRPVDYEDMQWPSQLHSTGMHRIAVLQQAHRYYENVLHGRGNFNQILDFVLGI